MASDTAGTSSGELKERMELLGDKFAKMHAGYYSFIEEMRGRQYGKARLDEAWSWFKKGWMARGR